MRCIDHLWSLFLAGRLRLPNGKQGMGGGWQGRETRPLTVGFLLVLCISIHSPWVSLFFPQYLLPLLTSHRAAFCGFLASKEPKSQGRKLLEQGRLAFNLTQQFPWKTSDSSYFIRVVLGTSFSSLNIIIAFLLSSLKRRQLPIQVIKSPLRAKMHLSWACPVRSQQQPFQCRPGGWRGDSL